jgi:hypothetical protein
MASNTDFTHSVNETNSVIPSGVAWGAAQIGAVIGRTERQAYSLLEGGHIKSAKKVGGRWQAGIRSLREEFGF